MSRLRQKNAVGADCYHQIKCSVTGIIYSLSMTSSIQISYCWRIQKKQQWMSLEIIYKLPSWLLGLIVKAIGKNMCVKIYKDWMKLSCCWKSHETSWLWNICANWLLKMKRNHQMFNPTWLLKLKISASNATIFFKVWQSTDLQIIFQMVYT